MNEIIKKFLETISISKDSWTLILLCILIILSISGYLHVKSLNVRIESLEESVRNWKDMARHHQSYNRDVIDRYEKELVQTRQRVKIEVEAAFYKAQIENMTNNN